MKRKIRTVALCALLAILAAGCQKENIDPIAIESMTTSSVISYSINGYEQTVQLPEEEIDGLINHLFDLAEQGYHISFWGDREQIVAAKDVITYTTGDRTDAIVWSKKMRDSGYAVNIEYDKDMQVYICTAIN